MHENEQTRDDYHYEEEPDGLTDVDFAQWLPIKNVGAYQSVTNTFNWYPSEGLLEPFCAKVQMRVHS